MDSLSYWVLEMQVDGFRFDLAAALAREPHDVDRLGVTSGSTGCALINAPDRYQP